MRPGWPVLITLMIVVGSAFIYTTGIGYGGWLMMTLPFSPVIYLIVRLCFRYGPGT
jgi:hypothetical protein